MLLEASEPGSDSRPKDQKSTVLRLGGLFCLFFLIALGLGYPMLNRYDPRTTPGLSDVKTYAAMVVGAPTPGYEHMQFRVLVPWIARLVYRVTEGHAGSWDPVLFGLLTADSLFVALTALLIVVLGIRKLGSYKIALVASLLYLVNFSTPNLRLVGLVDAGEGFFLLALLWTLSESAFWTLPLIAVLGTLTRESFVPFMIVFTAAWWVVERKKLKASATNGAWKVGMWITGTGLLSFLVMATLQWRISGHLTSPISFAQSLHHNHEYLQHLQSTLWDRSLLYVFAWLLPLGIPRLGRFPKSWLIAIACTSALAFVLNDYYGGGPGTVVRALYSIAGPVLTLSTASFLLEWKASEARERSPR